MKTKINNSCRMRQIIDFKGLGVDGYIYPTDIDGLIEYKDSEYMIFEVKYGDCEVPRGQRLALQRMVDDFDKAGKRAVVFICEHGVRDVSTPVVAAMCRVREVYNGSDHEWQKPEKFTTVKDALDDFRRSGK